MTTGLFYPLQSTNGRLDTATGPDLVACWIQWILDAYLPTYYQVFLPRSLTILAEDLKLQLTTYIPLEEAVFDVSATSSKSGDRIDVLVKWTYGPDVGEVTGSIAV